MTTPSSTDNKRLIVSLPKFVGLSLVTFGSYQLYWAWRAWEIVRQSKHEKYRVTPSVRGFFLPYSAFRLLPQLKELADAKGYRGNVGMNTLAAIYLIANLTGYSVVAPMWLGGISALVILFVLLPAVNAYNYYLAHTKTKFVVPRTNPPLIIAIILWGVITLGFGLWLMSNTSAPH
ncbi:MAG TPA: hypothetical protein VF466_05095 [Candidatus Saccharimonadales bacterium]